MCRVLHKYEYLRYFSDLRNGIIIIVPFRRSLKSTNTRMCAIINLDYGSTKDHHHYSGDFLIELVWAYH